MAKREEIFRFEIPGVLKLKFSGDNEGRLEKYLDRIGKSQADPVSWVRYASNTSGNWILPGHSENDVREFEWQPVFFETQYTLRCNFDPGLNVKDCRISHEMGSVERSVDYGDGILSGGLDFVNAPGKFKFSIEYDTEQGPKRLEIDWTIVSVKMDIKTDGERMVETIEKATPGLVQAFLSKSKGQGGLIPKTTDDEAIWYQIFAAFADGYLKACQYIVHRPHLKYVDHAEYLRADRIKRWSPQLANQYNEMEPGKRGIARFRSELIDPEVDTVENRFVKFTLIGISRKLRDFADLCKQKSGRVGEVFIGSRVEGYAERFERLLKKPFFRSIGKFTGFKQESLALQRKPGYAKIHLTWIALQQSLDATKSGIDIGEMPIWRLYEFWCFLAIAGLLESRYGEPVGKLDSAKTYYDLFMDPEDAESTHKGLSKMSYEFRDEVDGRLKRRIRLLYQQNYAETTASDHYANLNEQKPDIVMVVEEISADGKVTGSYTYLFDAKYRIEAKRQNGLNDLDASPKEPIDDMHRYRDAILYRAEKSSGKELTREVIGAYVLYPGRPNLPGQQRSFDYSTYIDEENIGAIAMLPGSDGLAQMTSFLNKVLAWSNAEQHLEKDIPTLGTSVVVGEAFGVDEIETIDLKPNEWPKMGQECVAVPNEIADKIRKVGYIRLRSNSHPLSIVKITDTGRSHDEKSTIFNIEWERPKIHP